ncbi:unnamed protein product (macronuclear) [Paramecium tetraurelia]|uniref:Phospholipid-transporting ATPase n=1 Tax=Paramecium tetraurelia TaxID=5888 RepID=A0DNE1_PARTE|nr:uncharacterized protein GSPATT00018754001 [Paramecium tetraurelia]CAK84558.1 unnamed protein product [Paramecium tetraurelia]|eukprot:XP_001451955.1 hypothetical protein (macronuclear) [Paramecium tetraurelia strain d4-2]
MFWSKRPDVLNQPRSFEGNFRSERTLEELEQFPSNFIKTSRQEIILELCRYNLVTFLPKSLLLQFTRYANIYFLCIAIIQCIPVLSTLNPFSAIAPLVFVLGLSMGREGWEDYGRHVSDNEVNATECVIMKSRVMTTSTWAQLAVGDFVLVKQDESFPADLIVLGSSIESGACYIETSSLDGEKNLKPKSAILESQQLYRDMSNFTEEKVKVEAQVPTQNLYELDASLFLSVGNGQQKKFQLTAKQLLLRGAFLRNTEWVIGLVVYTGQDTKIMRNADASRIKTSEIERIMNILILGILVVQISLSIITASFSSAWLHKYGSDSWYLGYGDFQPNLLSSLCIFQLHFIIQYYDPNLIDSQSGICKGVLSMYVQQRDKFAKVQTTTINEELGQIEYIFSDKTGTLTCNQMEFKYCIIGNTLYGQEQQHTNIPVQNVDLKRQQTAKVHPATDVFQHSVFNFQDLELSAILKGEGSSGEQPVNLIVQSLDGKQQVKISKQRNLIEEYFFLLSSAHECIVQYDKNQNANYQGPSPDEITLVDAAARMGFQFTGASASEQKFIILGKDKKVKLLKSFEFDSTRKRMSVIIDDNGVIKLFIKGADNIIKGRLSPNQIFLNQIINYLDDFSKIGLRCLLMAIRVLSNDEYREFDNAYNNLPDNDTRAEELEKLTNNLEQNLTLLGASAVEDKLQPLVPETIADLLKANIKVWMLTGDKLETAENIAKSCRLIQGDFTVMRLSELSVDDCKRKIGDIQETYDHCIKENRKKSFVVEGQSLQFVIDNEELAQAFVSMAKDCESVVCCRVTPKQKADVVRLIKDRLNKITLAIGDGANDVNMIQAAHIGVGLYGNEGMRAVQSSDFALGEFRCLWRLLLVHGHWNYIRIAEMVLYFFYKNMIFTVPQFFFSYFCAFSGQSFFDDWYITFYNLIFTALPLIMRGTFDQDINYRQHIQFDEKEEVASVQRKFEEYLKVKFPSLYFVGQSKSIFTIPNYTLWAFNGLVHGMIIFFFILWILDYEIVEDNGFPGGLAAFSLTVYSSIILIADLKIAIHTKYWTWFNFICITFLSVLLYIIYVIISQFWPGTLMEYTPFTMVGTPHFWLSIILIGGIIGGMEAIIAQLQREFFTDPAIEMLYKVNDFGQNQLKLIELKEKNQRQFQDSFWEPLYKQQQLQQQNEEHAE